MSLPIDPNPPAINLDIIPIDIDTTTRSAPVIPTSVYPPAAATSGAPTATPVTRCLGHVWGTGISSPRKIPVESL